MNFIELAIRLILTFFTLLTLTRLMGRKELSQMTFFNWASGITIGAIAAELVINSQLSMRNGLLALATWSILTIVMGFIDIKSKQARKLIEGESLIVINNGRIIDEALRKARLDLDALNSMLREQKVFSLSKVDYAIFETNGKLSVMQKYEAQSITKSDLNVTKKNSKFPIPTEVISDGEINTNSLSELNIEKKWLQNELAKAGIFNISDVFYAEIQNDGSLYIDKKNDQSN